MKSFFDLTEKSIIVPAKDIKDPTPGKKPTFKPNVSGIFEVAHEAHDEAEEHMSKAMAAHKEGNEALYNRHLSNYHDKMSEWHSERGRHGSAEKHNNLADVHHQKAIGLGEATSARLRFAAALNREQERIERERRLANPPSKQPEKEEPKKGVSEERKGLWDNIHAKRARIKNGSGERMRKPGSKGAPTADALKKSANEGVSEETIDRGEYDYEGQMARTQLQTIMRNSKDMIEMIKDDDNMPEWVQSKITLSHDYITTARDYLQSKQELGEDKDPCWDNYKQIGMKKKNGKQVPNCVPESYDDNRRGFGKRPREDDEYHVPDTVTTDHKITMNVSRPGAEKHNRTVTISNSTKTHDEAKATARSHLRKQGYTIHEEAEQIDELSKSTLGAYVKKSSRERGFSGLAAGGSGSGTRDQKDAVNTMKKRQAGVIKAVDRLTKEEVVAKSFPKDPNAPKMVKDRKTGKMYDPNKEFDKKMNSPEVKAQMKRMAKEDVESIDELKKSTLGSYVKKASNSATMRAYNAGGESARFAGEPISKRPDSYGADRKVAVKRLKGIDKATDRLTKEDTNHAIEEGIARLISKSIKRVTATKPTPQEKADIRLNK
jgi:hypothetical protein